MYEARSDRNEYRLSKSVRTTLEYAVAVGIALLSSYFILQVRW